MNDRTVYLSGGEGLAHGADGLGVLVCLFLHLQQLSGLDQRLQGLLGATSHQTFVSEPLLQLAHIVPANKHTHTKLIQINMTANKSHTLWRLLYKQQHLLPDLHAFAPGAHVLAQQQVVEGDGSDDVELLLHHLLDELRVGAVLAHG